MFSILEMTLPPPTPQNNLMLCFTTLIWIFSFRSNKSIHPKITAILNAEDDRERKVTWKKTDGSTIFAVRCCFRVTGAISEHYSFVETLNFAMRSSFQRTLALECSCFWRYAFVEPWSNIDHSIFAGWDCACMRQLIRKDECKRCLLPHPPIALFDLASDIQTKENSCICTILSVCPAKYNKMHMIRETLWRLLDVQYARNTLH